MDGHIGYFNPTVYDFYSGKSYWMTVDLTNKISYGSYIIPNSGEVEPPSFSPNGMKDTYEITIGKNQTTDNTIPLYAHPLHDYSFKNISEKQLGYTVNYKENSKKISIQYEIKESFYFNETGSSLGYGPISSEQPQIIVTGLVNENILTVTSKNMISGTYTLKFNYYMDLSTINGEKKVHIPMNIKVTIKDEENVDLVDQDRETEVTDSNLGYANSGSAPVDPNEVLDFSNISAGTNGDIKEYTDNVSNLITSIENDNFVIDTNMGTNSKKLIETILSYIIYIGILVSIVCIAILGFRYIMGSVADKAEYKETLVTFAIGSAILVGGISIVKFILSIALNW